jgi:hypothetical protein
MYAALLTLPLVTVPASAQQERTGQDQQRATPSADTSAVGREATGIPTGEVDPTKQQAPEAPPGVTTPPDDRDMADDAAPKTPDAASDVSTAGAPGMTAKLVDAGNKAKNREATVEVEVSGVEMVDPAQTDGQPNPGQGHIHYRVDGGPIVATPSTKLSFHELRPGRHQLHVQLAGNDHKPLGPEQTFTINVPS